MGFCQWAEMGPKVGQKWGFLGARVGQNASKPTLNRFRDIHENPLFTQFKGGWKLFSKNGREAVPTQHNNRQCHKLRKRPGELSLARTRALKISRSQECFQGPLSAGVEEGRKSLPCPTLESRSMCCLKGDTHELSLPCCHM